MVRAVEAQAPRSRAFSGSRWGWILVAGVGLPEKRPSCKGDTTTADTTQEPDLECNGSVEETTVTDTPFQRTKLGVCQYPVDQ